MAELPSAGEAQEAPRGILQWAIVRLIIYILGVVLVAMAATILTRLLVPPSPSPWHRLIMVKNLLLPIVELIVYAALVRRIERRPASEVALDRHGLGSFGVGMLLGVTMIAAVVLILWALGLATIGGGTGAQGLAAEILVPFTTATVEEILFRAILFRLAEHMLGTTPAAVLSAALFGLAHIGNPGATPMTSALIALDLGLPLAIAFAATRSLWMPIGLHMAWNIALGYLFGTLNSGVLDPHSLMRTTFAGPPWLTGGPFGLEASAVTLVLSLLLSAGLTRYAMARRPGWQPMRLRR